MNIKEAIKDYLIELEIRRYTPRTLHSYKTKLSLFKDFCDIKEVDDIEDVTIGLVKQYTQFMIQKNHKGSYINALLKTIKTFIQYCYEEGYGGFDTKRGRFRWVREEKTVIKTFTNKDIRNIMAACRGNTFIDIRDMAIMTMFFETGIRCLELISLRLEDIAEGHILIRGKNHKERVVPITPILNKALMRYNRARESYFHEKSTDPNFFLSRTGRMFNNSSVERIVKIRGAAVSGVRVSPHTCRHTWAQMQLKMGVDVYTISRLCGHDNIRTTQTYLESLRDEDVIKIAKQNSVLMNL